MCETTHALSPPWWTPSVYCKVRAVKFSVVKSENVHIGVHQRSSTPWANPETSAIPRNWADFTQKPRPCSPEHLNECAVKQIHVSCRWALSHYSQMNECQFISYSVCVCVCVGSTHWLLRASLSLWECGEGLAKLLLMSAVFNSEGKASAVSLTEPDSDCCMFVLDVKSWRLTLNRSQTQANTAQWGTSGRTQQDLVSAADGRGQTATLYVREVRVQGHSVNSSTLYLISITALEWRLRETVLQFI